jgi:hypothetical protein
MADVRDVGAMMGVERTKRAARRGSRRGIGGVGLRYVLDSWYVLLGDYRVVESCIEV